MHEYIAMSQQEISKVVGVSKSLVNRIIILKEEKGHLDIKRKEKYGRKHKTITWDDSFIMRKSKVDLPVREKNNNKITMLR